MHLRMFEVARDALAQRGYSVLGGYLSPVADAYSKPELAPAQHRLAMCELACACSDALMVDAWEATREGYTRTLQVLEHVAQGLQSYASSLDTASPLAIQVMLLCGADLLATMEVPGLWREPELLLQRYGVVTVARKGTHIAQLLSQPDGLLGRNRERILLVTDPVTSTLSSSIVREELRAGRCVRYLIPDTVISYIKQAGLYARTDGVTDCPTMAQ